MVNSLLQRKILVDRNTKHSATPRGGRLTLYQVWADMKKRCSNPNNKQYKDYGGRGITVCLAWDNSYTAFRDYMLGLKGCPVEAATSTTRLPKTIDRIRNNEGYKPGNMRWATRKRQNNNKRSNRIIQYQGLDFTLADLCEKHSVVAYGTLLKRLTMGWPIETALTKTSRLSV